MTRARSVLIAGGGIGGLAAAITLAQRGAQVQLFEKAPAFSEIGAGLQLSPNAMHVLAALGLDKLISAAGFTPEFAALRNYRAGKILLKTPLNPFCRARYGQAYIHIHRADLQRIFVQAARTAGVKLYLGAAITALEQNDRQITIHTQKGRFTGDILIGADGVRSLLRRHITPSAAPRFTGQIAWRGTLPASALPANSLPPAANVWMGPGKHFVAYYLRGGALINFIAAEERGDWQEESWSVKGDPAQLRAAFAGWDPRVTRLIEACAKDADNPAYLWGLFDHAPLAGWTQGRLTLLGDAAHPMLPFMAQGAAMAIEDAWVLSQQLLTMPDLDMALAAYETYRKPRASKIQSISRRNAALFHAARPFDRALRKAKLTAAANLPALQRIKLDPIYGVNVVKNFPMGSRRGA